MDKWTNGLKTLDARNTRERLARLIDECRMVSVGLEQLQGEGLRDQIAKTQLTLEKVAKSEIERLAAMLAEYRSGPPAAAAEPAPAAHPVVTPPYDAFAAARARAEAKAAAEAEPTTAPAVPPRPQMPRRGMRLPKLLPGRPS